MILRDTENLGERIDTKWFEQAVVEAYLLQLAEDAAVVCRHCHYPHVGVVQVLDDFHSVHLWHLNVHEHEGGFLVVEGGECVGDMMADDDLL